MTKYMYNKDSELSPSHLPYANFDHGQLAQKIGNIHCLDWLGPSSCVANSQVTPITFSHSAWALSKLVIYTEQIVQQNLNQ